jgi:hypothetical protein
MEEADGKPRRFFYGWVVFGVSGLVFAVVRGINDSFGVFLVAFVGEVSDEPALRAGAVGPAYRRHLSAPHGWTLRSALATPTLWLLFATRVMTPLGMMMVVPHHVAYLVGGGF